MFDEIKFMRSLILFLLMVTSSICKPQNAEFTTMLTGFSNPVDIAHCGDDRLFIVEKAGIIKIVEDETVLPTPFLNITNIVHDTGSEQGLLGLAFHPQYDVNGFFYVYYTAGSGNGTTRLSRFSVSGNPDIALSSSEVILWELAQPYSNHNGGDIDFGLDGFLYFAPGDGGSVGDPQNRSQNLNLAFGKVLRINPQVDGTYTIPTSNPYFGSTSALDEIWAVGLRNPWRFGFDRLNGNLWIGDVGQGLWEEVDFIAAGDNSGPNFGWRCYEGNAAYNTTGCQPQSFYDAPVSVGAHSAGWCSVIGGRVYRGTKYPSLYGFYIYTDYCHGKIYYINSSDFTGGVLNNISIGFGMACIAEDKCGELYAVNTQSGVLYRIVDPEVCPEDVNRDGLVKYTGSGNDRDLILTYIGGTLPTNVVPCDCCLEDVNGDGVVKYAGSNNDRDPILVKIGGIIPTNVVACDGGQLWEGPSDRTMDLPPIGKIRIIIDDSGYKKYYINENDGRQ